MLSGLEVRWLDFLLLGQAHIKVCLAFVSLTEMADKLHQRPSLAWPSLGTGQTDIHSDKSGLLFCFVSFFALVSQFF